MRETWKPVFEYEGLYEISDLGNIRGLTTNRLLKPGTGTSGYRYVQLSKNGFQLPKQIHRLVIEVFRGVLPKHMEVNHKNGIKTDNRLENLEKVTRSENILHRIHVLGVHQNVFHGMQHGNARFTDRQIKEMRRLYDNGLSYPAELARQFNCSVGAIHHIVKRRNWTHL
jgi:uncharacterized Fe-S cluster-containing radical SAM superfamily protein